MIQGRGRGGNVKSGRSEVGQDGDVGRGSWYISRTC